MQRLHLQGFADPDFCAVNRCLPCCMHARLLPAEQPSSYFCEFAVLGDMMERYFCEFAVLGDMMEPLGWGRAWKWVNSYPGH